MNSILFGIALSAVLSVTSLLIVLMRVSPLTAPAQALPAFFASLFLAISTVGALLLMALWRVAPFHAWDAGKTVTISLRQGILLGLGTMVVVLFHILELLNWWIVILIYAVFVLIEMACPH